MASDIQRSWNNAQRFRRPVEWASKKLTPAQRDEIRKRLVDDGDVGQLALEYGVSARTIRAMRG